MLRLHFHESRRASKWAAVFADRQLPTRRRIPAPAVSKRTFVVVVNRLDQQICAGPPSRRPVSVSRPFDGSSSVLLQHPYRRAFSDRLLGHSPMGAAAPLPLSHQSTHIPTKHEAEIGGVWAKDSAKRDKLLELKSELATATTDNAVPTLDSAATERQKLNLWLVDGLKLLARQTEISVAAIRPVDNKLATVVTILQEKLDKLPDQLHQSQWEETLIEAKDELSQQLSMVPADRCFQPMRDFYDASTELDQDVNSDGKTDDNNVIPKLSPEVREWLQRQQQQQEETNSSSSSSVGDPLWDNFVEALTRVRLQTTLSVVEYLQSASTWKLLTTVTDQDVDRAAVRHETAIDATTLSREKLRRVLTAYLQGSDTERVDSLWGLIDTDDDGLLDQEEVQYVATLAVVPVQNAWQSLLREALDASPVGFAEPVGWRQRRRAVSEKKRLIQLMGRAVKRHFADDLQQAHRIRCIYAWANKAHQDNKISSVLVEEEGGGVGTTVMGRKRYVELHPKISLSEFREVQSIHFPQVDRVGSELLKSYRNDLLVEQGKGRQRKALLWDCTMFFAGVCVLDYVILSL